MLLTLQTLKSKPLEEQVRVLERLTELNLDLYESISLLLEDRSEESIFRVSVSADRRKVVLVALLTIVAADIAAIPGEPVRRGYRENLVMLCRHLSVEFQDLVRMQCYAASIESLIKGEEQRPSGILSSS